MNKRDAGHRSPSSVGYAPALDAMWFGASKAAAQSSVIAVQAIRSLVAKFSTLAERQRSIAHLQRLDDRMLKDIGISRAEIMSVVHGLDRDRTRSRKIRKSI